MDEKLHRTIKGVTNWEDLRQLEANIKDIGKWDDEVGSAFKVRLTELGKAMIYEKSGISVQSLSPAEEEIVRATAEYMGLMRMKGKYPGRTLQQIRNRGLIGTAEAAVCRNRPTSGFETLSESAREDLSFEQIIINHPDEFSARALWYARKALGFHTEGRPPKRDSH